MKKAKLDSDLGIFVVEFTIVFHHHWMGHKKWEKHTIERKSKKEAQEYAEAYCYRKTDTFNNCDYYIVD